MSIEYPDHVIDVHAHVFNAHHLPVEGLLLGGMRVKEQDTATFRRWLARTVRNLVVSLVASEIRDAGVPGTLQVEQLLSVRPEHDTDDLLMADLYERLRLSIDSELSTGLGVKDLDSERMALQMRKLLTQEGLVATANELQRVFERAGSSETDEDLEQALKSTMVTPDVQHSLAHRVIVARLRGASPADAILSRGAWEWIIKQVTKRLVEWALDEGVSLLVFLARMLSSERKNVEAILGGYQAAQNVTTLVHMHMDMELAYPQPKSRNDDPYLTQEEQLSRMQALAREYEGQLIWFAAFDPRRCLAGRSVAEYCDWMRSYGCHGFKFYPPMGYRAANNIDPALQTVVDAFFAYCADPTHDVPIFAHCTPTGMQHAKGAGLHGDPQYWAAALAGNKKLRLCLGHAGGGHQKNQQTESFGWYAAQGSQWTVSNWAQQVVELCRAYENVYCEVGHLDKVLDSGSANARNLAANLIREWKNPVQQGQFAFGAKVMYGSDAVMPGVVRHTSSFLEAFRQVFAKGQMTQGDFVAFTGKNARAYLRL